MSKHFIFNEFSKFLLYLFFNSQQIFFLWLLKWTEWKPNKIKKDCLWQNLNPHPTTQMLFFYRDDTLNMSTTVAFIVRLLINILSLFHSNFSISCFLLSNTSNQSNCSKKKKKLSVVCLLTFLWINSLGSTVHIKPNTFFFHFFWLLKLF